MKNIFIILLILTMLEVTAQDFRHEFTQAKDSVKLQGLSIFLEIDSVYQINDSSGVRFAMEIINKGTKTLRLTNPFYDTKSNIWLSLWLLPSKKSIQLKEVSRWPNPRLSETMKPYRLEKAIISGKEMPKEQYSTYWETDTLNVEPNQDIRYELNLFEHVIFDEEVKFKMNYASLPKGEYYVIFNISLDLGSYYIRSKPLRFKLHLK